MTTSPAALARDEALQNNITVSVMSIGDAINQLMATRKIKSAAVAALVQQAQTGIIAGVALLMNVPRKDA